MPEAHRPGGRPENPKPNTRKQSDLIFPQRKIVRTALLLGVAISSNHHIFGLDTKKNHYMVCVKYTPNFSKFKLMKNKKIHMFNV